jgi:hypothetical protein
LIGGGQQEIVPPVIALFVPRHGVVASLENDDILDRRRIGARGVDIVLERHNFAATPGAVGGDDEFAAGILTRSAMAVDEKPPVAGERGDSRAGEHGDGRFRNHSHVDGDDIAFFTPSV